MNAQTLRLDEADGYAALGMLPEALEALDAIPASEQSSPRVFARRVKLLLALGRWQEATESARSMKERMAGADSQSPLEYWIKLGGSCYGGRQGGRITLTLVQIYLVWPEGSSSISHYQTVTCRLLLTSPSSPE